MVASKFRILIGNCLDAVIRSWWRKKSTDRIDQANQRKRIDDPFATFTEWDSEVDRRSYERL